jgi:hypothetical protein
MKVVRGDWWRWGWVRAIVGGGWEVLEQDGAAAA